LVLSSRQLDEDPRSSLMETPGIKGNLLEIVQRIDPMTEAR
jgi:hypothetical protein